MTGSPLARFLFLTTLLIAIPAVASAAGFNDIHSRDGADVWAVGPGGAVHRSLDSGASWAASSLGDKDLNGVAARGFTVWVVGDSGKVYRSVDAGAGFGLSLVAGAPDLNAISMPGDSTGYVVGDGGVVLKTVDAGATWAPQTSTTVENLNAVHFVSEATGWVAGANGTVLRTLNGGGLWSAVAAGATGHLLDIDARGADIWAVGEFATAVHSANGGLNWNPVDLDMDSGGDVREVRIETTGDVTLAGGGGFVRRTSDAGATWTFLVHELLAPVSAMHFIDGGIRGWVGAADQNVIAWTDNGGSQWKLPTGTTSNFTWTRKQSHSGGGVRGNTFSAHPASRNTFFGVLADNVYRSENGGEVWKQVLTLPGTSKTNSFYVSPADSNLMVAAVGTPDRIIRSTNGGTNWTTTFTAAFSEYGMPLELNPDDPDSLMFMPEDGNVYVSGDFGATWDSLSAPGFRSPCDVVIVPGASNVIWVGDGVTSNGNGEIWTSTDGGLTFGLKHTTAGSEIPMIGVSRLNNSVGIATAWASGGVVLSSDWGETWSFYDDALSAWGCAIAGDDPNVAFHGRFNGNEIRHTVDLGDSITTVSISGPNYALYAPDRATAFAMQANGIYKMSTDYTVPGAAPPSLAFTSPDGGNVIAGGSVFPIQWTAQNVAVVDVEYRTGPLEPWQWIATVNGYDAFHNWNVPFEATTEARVRVVDISGAVAADMSASDFTIATPLLSTDPDSVAFGMVEVSSSAVDTVDLANDGTATLTITNITSSNPRFTVSRTSLSLGPGGSDTVTVTFVPTAVGSETATLSIVSDDPFGPDDVFLSGTGQQTTGVGDLTGVPQVFALGHNRPNPFERSTRIDYALPVDTRVRLDVYNIQGRRVAVLVDDVQAAGRYSVDFGPGAAGADGSSVGSLASGVYFYRLKAGEFSRTRRMLLVH